MNQATRQAGTFSDAVNDASTVFDRAGFETWGRHVEYSFVTATGIDDAAQRVDAAAVIAERPFAVVVPAATTIGIGGPVFECAVADADVLVVGYPTTKEAIEQAPYRWAASIGDDRGGVQLTAEFVDRSSPAVARRMPARLSCADTTRVRRRVSDRTRRGRRRTVPDRRAAHRRRRRSGCRGRLRPGPGDERPGPPVSGNPSGPRRRGSATPASRRSCRSPTPTRSTRLMKAATNLGFAPSGSAPRAPRRRRTQPAQLGPGPGVAVLRAPERHRPDALAQPRRNHSRASSGTGARASARRWARSPRRSSCCAPASTSPDPASPRGGSPPGCARWARSVVPPTALKRRCGHRAGRPACRGTSTMRGPLTPRWDGGTRTPCTRPRPGADRRARGSGGSSTTVAATGAAPSRVPTSPTSMPNAASSRSMRRASVISRRRIPASVARAPTGWRRRSRPSRAPAARPDRGRIGERSVAPGGLPRSVRAPRWRRLLRVFHRWITRRGAGCPFT